MNYDKKPIYFPGNEKYRQVFYSNKKPHILL